MSGRARLGVIVAGYLSLDDLVCPAGRYRDVPGGGALYAALAAARAGARPLLVARAGADFPDSALRAARQAGVDIGHVVRHPGPSRRATLIEPSAREGRRHSPLHDDAAWWERTEALVPAPPPGLAADLVIVAPMPLAAASRHLAAARDGGALAALDTSEAFAAATPQAVRDLAGAVEIFAPSVDEIRLLAPGLEPEAARADLAALCPILLEKRGPDGARLSVRGSVVAERPSHAAAVRDTTGAGDALAAAFAVALAGGAAPEAALEAGLRMAALAVSNVGPSAFGLPVRALEEG